MKASILLIAASAGAALAHPAALTECAELCSSRLYNIPNCCTSDILGFAALDCTTPPGSPTSASEFKSSCSARGKAAKCCVVPVAGLDVLCQDV